MQHLFLYDVCFSHFVYDILFYLNTREIICCFLMKFKQLNGSSSHTYVCNLPVFCFEYGVERNLVFSFCLWTVDDLLNSPVSLPLTRNASLLKPSFLFLGFLVSSIDLFANPWAIVLITMISLYIFFLFFFFLVSDSVNTHFLFVSFRIMLEILGPLPSCGINIVLCCVLNLEAVRGILILIVTEGRQQTELIFKHLK